MSEWLPLTDLPRGMVFETRDGTRAVKSEYRYPNGGCECTLLASGEYAHFAQGKPAAVQGQLHNATLVRPLAVLSTRVPQAPGDSIQVLDVRAVIVGEERGALACLDRCDIEAFCEADSRINALRAKLYRLRRAT